MSDMISRKAAIDAIRKLYIAEPKINNDYVYDMAIDQADYALRALPSAEPPTKCVAEIRIDKEDLEDFVAEKVEEIKEAMSGNWTPCSERLPKKEEQSYWICLDSGGQCQCRWTNDMYGFGANEYSEWGWHIMDKPQYSKVVAWMPLPEPYKAEYHNDCTDCIKNGGDWECDHVHCRKGSRK